MVKVEMGTGREWGTELSDFNVRYLPVLTDPIPDSRLPNYATHDPTTTFHWLWHRPGDAIHRERTD